jgi:hypothetical protein
LQLMTMCTLLAVVALHRSPYPLWLSIMLVIHHQQLFVYPR